MLLRKAGTGVLAISQPMHAWVAGDLATAWGGPDFAIMEPRTDLVRAVALHDIGWLGWERAPQFDGRTGFPLEFQNVLATDHSRLWTAGVDDVEIYGAYVALLVSRHGEAIYERTFDAGTAAPEQVDAVNRFLGDQRRIQARLIAKLSRDPAMTAALGADHLALTKRFILAVDTMSLNLCWGIDHPVAIEDVPDRSGAGCKMSLIAMGDDVVIVDPWPFMTDQVKIAIEGRRLPHPSATQVQLDDALREADLAWHVTTLIPQ